MTQTAPVKPTQLDYYTALGIARNAKYVEIRKRYLSLVQEAHPDRYTDPEEKARRAAQFKDIGEAWEILSNPELRKQYDVSLAGGQEFDPQLAKREGPRNQSSISAEVASLGFAETVSNLPAQFLEIVNGMLFDKDPSFRERPISSFKVVGHSLKSMPLNCIRGVGVGECYAVITNLGLVGAVSGEPEARSGNTRYTMKYTNGFRLNWIETQRMDLELDPMARSFAVTFYGHENRLSGVRFQCNGSPYPLLWLADLYDLETVLKIKYSRLFLREIGITFLIVALLALTGYLHLGLVTRLSALDPGTAQHAFAKHPFVTSALVALVVLTPIHLLVEYRRARRDRRLQRLCEAYRRTAEAE